MAVGFAGPWCVERRYLMVVVSNIANLKRISYLAVAPKAITSLSEAKIFIKKYGYGAN